MEVNFEVVFQPEVPVNGCGFDSDALQVRAEGLDALAAFYKNTAPDMTFRALGSGA